MKYRIWNVDRALYAAVGAFRLRVASDMADALEARTGDRMTLRRVTC